MTAENLAGDPLIRTWLAMREIRPDFFSLGAVTAESNSGVLSAINLASAANNYVACIMMRLPEPEDTIH